MRRRTLIRLRKVLRNRRVLVALATFLLSATFVLGMAGTALAAEEEAPKLDYEFRWWSFLICVVLVVGFYALVYAVSLKEFKQVINDHFGPKK